MKIIELKIDRYNEVLSLMERTPGISVREADSNEAVTKYLKRNDGFSFVAEIEGEVVACAMSGHDGRRGYLQHVVVDERFRNQGIASMLVANDLANSYWSSKGWEKRDDIYRYSYNRSDNSNA